MSFCKSWNFEDMTEEMLLSSLSFLKKLLNLSDIFKFYCFYFVVEINFSAFSFLQHNDLKKVVRKD